MTACYICGTPLQDESPHSCASIAPQPSAEPVNALTELRDMLRAEVDRLIAANQHDDTALLRQALEALDTCDAEHPSDGGRQWYDSKAVDAAIAALRERLEGKA